MSQQQVVDRWNSAADALVLIGRAGAGLDSVPTEIIELVGADLADAWITMAREGVATYDRPIVFRSVRGLPCNTSREKT